MSCDYHQMGGDATELVNDLFLFNGIKDEKETDMDALTFVTEMKKAKELSKEDPELGHVVADNLMADVLAKIGYNEGVVVFREMERNY